jgi:hypothetical protein
VGLLKTAPVSPGPSRGLPRAPRPIWAWGRPWLTLCGRAAPPQMGRGRRGWSRLAGPRPPIRPGAAGWASGIPAGSPLPRGSFWPSPFLRSSTPRRFRILPFRGGLLPAVGGEPEARPSPLSAPRPALEVEAPRVPVQAFGPRCWDDVPPRHHRASGTPCGSRFGLAYSPGLPLWCERLIPGPSGFPPRACTTTSRRGFAALRYGHHPEPPHSVRPSRPEVPPLASSYSDVRPYDPPTLLR